MNKKLADISSLPADNNTPTTPEDISSEDFFSTKQADHRNEEVLIRKRKRRKKKHKKLHVVVIILLVLAAVGVGVAFGINRLISAGEKSLQTNAEDTAIKTIENAVTYDEGKTVTYKGVKYELNENMVSIMVVGFDRATFASDDEEAGQADAIMVLALDTQTGKTTALGIPRDSMVEVDQYASGAFIGQDVMQVCLAYSFGDGSKTSCENTARAVSRLLYNIPLSYYFGLDEGGVGEINDSIGGVALTPLQSIPKTSVVEGEPIVLFGNNALRYVKYRDTSILTSALDRQARQTQYVQAFASQTLAQGNLNTFIDLFNTASAYSVTNLGIEEFSYLTSTVLSSGITSLNMTTLPGEMKSGPKYAEFYVDETAVYETILDVYYTPVK